MDVVNGTKNLKRFNLKDLAGEVVYEDP